MDDEIVVTGERIKLNVADFSTGEFVIGDAIDMSALAYEAPESEPMLKKLCILAF